MLHFSVPGPCFSEPYQKFSVVQMGLKSAIRRGGSLQTDGKKILKILNSRALSFLAQTERKQDLGNLCKMEVSGYSKNPFVFDIKRVFLSVETCP